jgi:hypothetical protein
MGGAERSATADVPFGVIGVPFRRGVAASSELSVSFSFIHTNDMPVSREASGFPFARKCFKTALKSGWTLTIIDGFSRCALP